MPDVRPACSALLVLAAVIAAFVIAIFAAGPAHAALSPLFGALPFAKVFRYLLLASLLAVWLVAARPWKDVPSDVWGFTGPRSRPSLWFLGFAIGVASLVSIALLDAAVGQLSWEANGTAKAWNRIPTALTLLLLLSPIEEMFFRGWMFDRFRARFAERTTHLAVAAVFASIHAFRERDAPKQLAASASGALDVLAAWGRNLVDWREFGPSFVGLFLLSLVASAARRRWGTLWFGIGLHGATAWLPIHSALTERSVERDWTGSKWLYDGVPGWLVLTVVLLLVARRPKAAVSRSSPRS